MNGGSAAGILLYATSTSDMSHNVIQGNTTWNNAQGIALVFDNSASQITYEQIQNNKAFYLSGGGGTVQNYGIQTYCNATSPSPGSCALFGAVVYANNVITGNDLSNFNNTGSSSITSLWSRTMFIPITLTTEREEI